MGARLWKLLLLILAGLFAADLAALLGMAIKYAGLREKEVRVDREE